MDGYYHEWYDDFSPYSRKRHEKVIGQYEKGLMNGEWTYFNINGKKRATGKFINGDGSNKSELTMIPKNGIDGEWKFWYDSESHWMDGSLREISNYSNGKLNGISTLYHKNGQKIHLTM